MSIGEKYSRMKVKRLIYLSTVSINITNIIEFEEG